MTLDDRVIQQIKDAHARLEGEQALPSPAELAEYYRTFRQRFGPDQLAGLDGEALLHTMHAHGNQDSLVYWLEFKNDDEFPTRVFGGIGGGTAFKFGLFRRKETGVWVTGSPQRPKDLTVEEAVQVARSHRDQLLRGVRILESLPNTATDEVCAHLQQRMDAEAPDVGNSSWGHKYFSLLFPDKLDDYHAASYQRFHLIKALQMPPEGEGRYVAAGRYVSMARELNLPINHLTAILNVVQGEPYRYWRIGTRLGGTDSRWPLMRDGGCVAVGWALIRDLSDLSYDTESKEALRALILEHYPTTPQNVGRETQQLFNYVMALKEGDIVLPSDGKRVLGIGRILGPYSFLPGSDAPHRRPVRWLSLEEWTLPTTEGLRTTVHEIRTKADNLIAIERRLLNIPVQNLADEGLGTAETPPALAGIPGRIQSILERKGQVILYGPPGTGKTYWAIRAARELAALAAFRVAYDQLTDEQRTVVSGDKQGADGLVRICTFHPAYGYEDFLEGYKPVPGREELTFDLFDGVFKKLCRDAGENAARRFYLIIDEINRGDIPRIFGELLTVLEKDKRGQGILLPLSRERFEVPENVYVIGTMNTADRSIALLDTALRRRFGFVELMPDGKVLGDTVIEGIPLAQWLDELNTRIRSRLGRDARNLQIGHAYLLEGGKPVTDFPRFCRILQDDILPLVQEYCYEDYDALAEILGEGLFDRDEQRIRTELFLSGSKEDLRSALLEPNPDLATTRPAVTVGAEQLEEESAEEDDESAP
jgi:5-methylcytosine-specific restriction protein B